MLLDRGSRLFARLRIKRKLAVSLSVAALIPVLAVSWVAVSVVLQNLEQALRDETEHQLRVGLGLVLRRVERIGAEAVRLAGSGLDAALSGPAPDARDPKKRERVQRFLEAKSQHLPAALVQVFDASGQQIGTTIVGNVPARFVGLHVGADKPPVRDALAYRNTVTIDADTGVLAVHAAAPVLDASFRLHGVVVLSVPLDGPSADSIKGALGTDVLIFAYTGPDAGPALSTFLDGAGGREKDIRIDPAVAARVHAGETVLENRSFGGHPYAVGYTPLIDLDGKHIGVFAVAVDRAQLLRAKRIATRSLILGAAGAFVFALLLAGLLSRRLTGPLARLHRGALAVARGDLDYEIHVSGGDEIGDLATAFTHMTGALKENQTRLAARMRELLALHNAARAVSSVIDLGQVLRQIVDSVARVLDVRLCALWLVEEPDASAIEAEHLTLGAARAKLDDSRATLHGAEGAQMADPLRAIAVVVAASRATLRIDDVARDPSHREAALCAGVTGSLMATPLERKGGVVGVLVVARAGDAEPFSDADSNLLATFADQAAAAVENARLYEEVRAFNEELEGKVRSRTAELTHMNAELGRALSELGETQAQLILSERMAGLGLLVAGVAHEVNSPSAAIAGSVDALAGNVVRLTELSQKLAGLPLDSMARAEYQELVSHIGATLAARHLSSAVVVRQTAKTLSRRLQEAGVPEDSARSAATRLAELGADETLRERFFALVTGGPPDRAGERAQVLAGYLTEHVFLHRNALTIRNAINRIQRIVGALKAYSHLDQQARLVDADVHEGIEDTLVILDYVLRDIKVIRSYGRLPKIPVYIDELNQVWTNLILNSVQAMAGKGRITIETVVEEGAVVVRVTDDGPGIAPEVLPHIFEPFFTTKGKGEGTGLGLRIVQQIIEKHRGEVLCDSRAGRTCFVVRLPMSQPANEPGLSESLATDAALADVSEVGS